MRKIHLRHPTIKNLTKCGHQCTSAEYARMKFPKHVNCKHCLNKKASKKDFNRAKAI